MSAHQNITLTPVESSQIEAIGYDYDSETLAIRFKGKEGKDGAPAKPGSLYHYAYVKPEEWAAFSGAESIGSHFYKHIKPYPDRHPYTRIPEAEAA